MCLSDDDLALLSLLPLPSQYCDYRLEPPHPVYSGNRTQGFMLLDRYSTNCPISPVSVGRLNHFLVFFVCLFCF